MYAFIIALIVAQIIFQFIGFKTLPIFWHWPFRILSFLLILWAVFAILPNQIADYYMMALPIEEREKKRCGMPIFGTTTMIVFAVLLISAIVQLLIVETSRIFLLRRKNIAK
jgi:hypothetical protein